MAKTKKMWFASYDDATMRLIKYNGWAPAISINRVIARKPHASGNFTMGLAYPTRREMCCDTIRMAALISASTGKAYVPVMDADGNKLEGWWMAGGCYITTSDSRFPFGYPIPLHDRQE